MTSVNNQRGSETRHAASLRANSWNHFLLFAEVDLFSSFCAREFEIPLPCVQHHCGQFLDAAETRNENIGRPLLVKLARVGVDLGGDDDGGVRREALQLAQQL